MTRPMRRIRHSPSILGVVGALLLAAGCTDRKGVISQNTLLEQLQNGENPIILDVRTPREYQQGHVPGAVNLPYQQIGRRLAELEQLKDREVIVYCEVGPRARVAQSVLQQAGFTDVRHLAGDMAGWRRAGLPTSR